MLVQAFLSEATHEALDVSILSWLSRLDEVEEHAVLVAPLIESEAAELRTVIKLQLSRSPAADLQFLQSCDNAFATNRPSDFNGERFSSYVIHDRKTTKRPSIDDAVVNEVW
jgi:hypothetical protein